MLNLIKKELKQLYSPTNNIFYKVYSNRNMNILKDWQYCKSVFNSKFSEIGKMVIYANSLNEPLIRLEIGDVDLSPPKRLIHYINQALYKNKTHYPPFKGEQKLISEIIRLEKENYGINLTKDQILITSGASMGLFITFMTLLNPDDEALIIGPIWPHIPEMISIAKAKPVQVDLNPDTKSNIDFSLLENAVTKKTRLIVLNNPNNPTGKVCSLKEIKLIVRLAHKYNLAIVSDEEYISFYYGKEEVRTPFSYYKGTVSCRSFSKTLAISGLRLGYLIGPKTWIEQISKCNLYSSMYSCSLTQYAVGEFLSTSDYKRFVDLNVNTFRNRMCITSKKINEIINVTCNETGGSIYLWPDFRKTNIDDYELARRLIKYCKVVTVPGSVFGTSGKGFLRLSLSNTQSQLNEAVKNIKLLSENKWEKI